MNKFFAAIALAFPLIASAQSEAPKKPDDSKKPYALCIVAHNAPSKCMILDANSYDLVNGKTGVLTAVAINEKELEQFKENYHFEITIRNYGGVLDEETGWVNSTEATSKSSYKLVKPKTKKAKK